MKNLIFASILYLIVFPGFCQKAPKNVIAFETGLFNKGLVGLSYSRLITLNKSFDASLEFGGGFGIGWNGLNQYAAAGIHLLAGESSFKFSLGADVKYYNVSLWDYKIYILSNPETRPNFNGVTLAPAMGMCYQGESGFYFRLRGTINRFKSSQEDRIRPGYGVSLGFNF